MLTFLAFVVLALFVALMGEAFSDKTPTEVIAGVFVMIVCLMTPWAIMTVLRLFVGW